MPAARAPPRFKGLTDSGIDFQYREGMKWLSRIKPMNPETVHRDGGLVSGTVFAWSTAVLLRERARGRTR